jgi:Protein of unknown function (DUF3570)
MPTKRHQSDCTKSAVSLLTGAALLLPGLGYDAVFAAEDDSVDFQYSHYQEGKRDGINLVITPPSTGVAAKYALPNKRDPIEVDSLHGSGRISLTDRIKFAFNYIQDTWAGATPYGSAPEQSNANGNKITSIKYDENGKPILVGASPYASTLTYFDKNNKPYYALLDPTTGQSKAYKDKAVHVLGFASPETRKQGDFKLSYAWDDAALEAGGGISIERDYESRFVNLGGRLDFNQKQTTVNAGLSYTNSTINAFLDPNGSSGADLEAGKQFFYFRWSDQHNNLISFNPRTALSTLSANREDWATHMDLSQVINKNAVLNMGMGYTRSTGFLENPYKTSWIFGVDPNLQPNFTPEGYVYAKGLPFIEQRPDARNQWNWTARWSQYVDPLDAAMHLGYNFYHDDWGINAHTFDADWVQPVGWGWTVTPRIRYYSQEAADFYQPFFKVNADFSTPGLVREKQYELPDNFSSDQRLSGYGALSGGITVEKQFAKGIGLEAGFEYYTHQGGLKLGGGGERAFADFDYWTANAALKVNLDALGRGIISGGNTEHESHHGHANVPAGVMFAHVLDKTGDMMLGYRYQRSQQAGDLLRGDKTVSNQLVNQVGCPGASRIDVQTSINSFDGPCTLLPKEMTMSMHMLELMYAPADWMTLMLMPQWMDMDMDLYQYYIDPNSITHIHNHAGHKHETGGIGDTGLYALVKLFDHPNHHIHANMGFTAPTGDVGNRLKYGTKYLNGGLVHYGMQLGSGTWDFKPSLTYLGSAGEWSWGAQLAGTKRMESKNSSGYALGDMFEGSVWGGYDITHWLSGTVRVAYTWQGAIHGKYPRSSYLDYALESCDKAAYTSTNDPDGDGIPNGPDIFDQASYNQCLASIEDAKRTNDANDRPSPMDFPKNYGGQYVDMGFGLSATVPSGSLAGNKLSFEWLQPVYTQVNGYQLDRDGALSFTWSYGF